MEEQMDIFDFIKEPFKIDKPVRLIELFAGIGAQAKALERLNVDFEHYRVVEFDKYAIASYNAIHGTSFETSDIRDVHAADLGINEIDNYTYIMTYSFPCQDLSIAGKRKGMKKGDGTRSGLLWEVERILRECDELPQVLLMENVTQVHGKVNIDDFKKWLSFLESIGYENYWKDLNAKDFGIPQNRNRCFMVSVHKGYSYTFPKKQKLTLRLKDMLEGNVDEKYYLSEKALKYILAEKQMNNNLTGSFVQDKCVQVAQMYGTEKEPNPQAGRIYDSEYISPTIDSCNGGNRMPKILIKNNTKQGYIEAYAGDSINLEHPNSKTRRGRVGKQVSQTLTTSCNQGVLTTHSTIRKLITLECWRLMGFDDEDFYKAKEVNSDSQLYKQAGNSIVVNVLVAIFKEMI